MISLSFTYFTMRENDAVFYLFIYLFIINGCVRLWFIC